MITYTVKVSEDKTEWYLNDKRHREDGPAVEYKDGYKAWFLNGKRHREDSPAVEYGNSYKAWFLNGKQLTEQEFNDRTTVTELTLEQIATKFGISVDQLKIKNKIMKEDTEPVSTIEKQPVYGDTIWIRCDENHLWVKAIFIDKVVCSFDKTRFSFRCTKDFKRFKDGIAFDVFTVSEIRIAIAILESRDVTKQYIA